MINKVLFSIVLNKADKVKAAATQTNNSDMERQYLHHSYLQLYAFLNDINQKKYPEKLKSLDKPSKEEMLKELCKVILRSQHTYERDSFSSLTSKRNLNKSLKTFHHRALQFIDREADIMKKLRKIGKKLVHTAIDPTLSVLKALFFKKNLDNVYGICSFTPALLTKGLRLIQQEEQCAHFESLEELTFLQESILNHISYSLSVDKIALLDFKFISKKECLEVLQNLADNRYPISEEAALLLFRNIDSFYLEEGGKESFELKDYLLSTIYPLTKSPWQLELYIPSKKEQAEILVEIVKRGFAIEDMDISSLTILWRYLRESKEEFIPRKMIIEHIASAITTSDAFRYTWFRSIEEYLELLEEITIFSLPIYHINLQLKNLLNKNLKSYTKCIQLLEIAIESPWYLKTLDLSTPHQKSHCPKVLFTQKLSFYIEQFQSLQKVNLGTISFSKESALLIVKTFKRAEHIQEMHFTTLENSYGSLMILDHFKEACKKHIQVQSYSTVKTEGIQWVISRK